MVVHEGTAPSLSECNSDSLLLQQWTMAPLRGYAPRTSLRQRVRLLLLHSGVKNKRVNSLDSDVTFCTWLSYTTRRRHWFTYSLVDGNYLRLGFTIGFSLHKNGPPPRFRPESLPPQTVDATITPVKDIRIKMNPPLTPLLATCLVGGK